MDELRFPLGTPVYTLDEEGNPTGPLRYVYGHVIIDPNTGAKYLHTKILVGDVDRGIATTVVPADKLIKAPKKMWTISISSLQEFNDIQVHMDAGRTPEDLTEEELIDLVMDSEGRINLQDNNIETKVTFFGEEEDD